MSRKKERVRYELDSGDIKKLTYEEIKAILRGITTKVHNSLGRKRLQFYSGIEGQKQRNDIVIH